MASLAAAVDNLVEESRALWVPLRVAEYTTPPQTLPFLRDHVALSTPCVWRGAAAHWPAVRNWSNNNFHALRSKVGHHRVAVTSTPDGRADAVVELSEDEAAFAMPHHTILSFSTLLDSLNASYNDGDDVLYYSPQDTSLAKELAILRVDFDEGSLTAAAEALGEGPQAPNLWVGNTRSVTATHADPFDNLYVVISGRKLFELRPPCDAAVLPKPELRRARWTPVEKRDNDGDDDDAILEELQPTRSWPGWRLVGEEGRTAWIDEERIPERAGSALQVSVNAGDIFYLPALWFHRVSQEGVTIAANWWFEMPFGRDWIYREFCAQLGKLQTGVGDAEMEPERAL